MDQHLLLDPSIDKQRELSCAPNIIRIKEQMDNIKVNKKNNNVITKHL